MSELVQLTIPEARDLLRLGELSSVSPAAVAQR